MKKIITVLLTLTFLTLIKSQSVLADDSLKIKHNGKLVNGSAIFKVENMLPGDTANETIEVKNTGSKKISVGVKGVKTGGTPAAPFLENVLDFKIAASSDIFGGGLGAKTLADFFAASGSSYGVNLGEIDSHQNASFTFTGFLPTSVGNPYQKKSVIFNLIFSEIPEGKPPEKPCVLSFKDWFDRDNRGRCVKAANDYKNHWFNNFRNNFNSFHFPSLPFFRRH
jgi:hypothetical protein